MPLDIEESVEKVEDNPENVADNLEKVGETVEKSEETIEKAEETIEKSETIPEEKEKPEAKKRGRPKGSVNKAPQKPRAPKKAVVIEETPVEVEEKKPEKEYEPSSPKKDRMVNDVAVEVLRLLQNQAHVRQEKKRAQYASWFR